MIRPIACDCLLSKGVVCSLHCRAVRFASRGVAIVYQAATSDPQVPVKCPEYNLLRGFWIREEGLSRLNPAEPVGVWRVMSPTSYQAAPPRVIATTRLPFLLQPHPRQRPPRCPDFRHAHAHSAPCV